MSDWHVVCPESTENLISHPSIEAGTAAELAAFVAVNVATRAQSTTQSRWGLYSLAITPHAANAHSGVYYQVTGIATTTYTLSVWVYGTLGVAYQLRLEDSTPATLATTAFVGTGAWQLVEVTGTTLANVTIRCHLTADLGGTPVFYADGWQLEQKAYRTTYCDGERDGCEWIDVPHASTSSRPASSRAGGRIRDLEDVYGLNISGMSDFGVAPQSLTVDEFAILPGGEMGGSKIHPRSFTLSATIICTSTADLHSKRQALIALFDPEAYPDVQPILLRYTGAMVEKEIAARYQSGLEAIVRATDPCFWEKVAIRFIADQPFWREVGQTSWVLDSNDSDTFRRIAGRLRSTGQWDILGVLNAAGTPGWVFALAWGPDGKLYIGGSFAGWNGTAGAASIDYIGCWDPLTDTWAQVGAAGDLNGHVYALAFDSAGLLHVGGAFSNAGGVGAADFLATHDGTSWAAVGVPGFAVGREIRDIAWDSDGNLYVVGDFENWAGVAAADYLAMWNGVVWAGVGTPLAGTAAITKVYAIVINSSNQLFVGGEFLNWADIANADHIAQYNTTDGWTALGTLVLDGHLRALALRPGDEVLHLGGRFTTFGGTTLSAIGLWTGYNFEPLGSGLLPAKVNALAFGPDGTLFIVGEITQTGDTATQFPDGFCIWNGTVFEIPDANFDAATHGYAVIVGSIDPIIQQNYDVFIGTNRFGVGWFSGTATIVNTGTELLFPTINISRSGGTVARIVRIRNETTGREILCDYPLLDDETLKITLEPTERGVVSSYFGPRLDAVQASSDFGDFALQVGSNQVTCFVDVTGAPTIVAWMVGRLKFASQD